MKRQLSTVITQDNVRQWRDFLDVLLFARQNRAELVVPDKFPGIDSIIELKTNTATAIESINYNYARNYRDLRVYRGKFDSISSLLVLKNSRISSGRNFEKKGGERILCYCSSNSRNQALESNADFLAIALMNKDYYVGTKIFMKDYMIELMSL